MIRGLVGILLALALLLAAFAPAAQAAGLATTRVDIRDRADIDRGESVLFPIRVANDGTVQAAYRVTLTGTDGWATWRVDPNGVTIPGGHEGYLYLRLDTDRYAQGGERTVTVRIESGRESADIPIAVDLHSPVPARAGGWIGILQASLLALLLLLLLAAVGVASRHRRASARVDARGQPPATIAPARREQSRVEHKLEVVELAVREASAAKADAKAPARKRRQVAVEPAEPHGRLETRY